MSAISPDELNATQAPSAAQPYAPPAWMQPDQQLAEMSAISPDQSATRRITVRLPNADLTALDARADAINASRSEYLRTLIALPVTLDLSSIRRATPGVESITRPFGPELALKHTDSQTNSLTVQAITDSALESISNEIRSIGVNYNQSVRALNRILKKIRQSPLPLARRAHRNHRTLRAPFETEQGDIRTLEDTRRPSRVLVRDTVRESDHRRSTTGPHQ